MQNSCRVTITIVFCLIVSGIAPALAEDYKSTTAAGLAALDNDQFDEAEKQFKKAMSLSLSGPKYGDYSIALINLGNVFAKHKQTPQAEKYYKEALSHYHRAFGPKSMESSTVNECLGDLYRKSGQFERAIPYYESAKAVREESAKEHPDLAETLAGLAACYSKTGKKDEAIVLMQNAVAIREKAYGRLSGKVLKSRYNLAQLYDDLGKHNMAIAAYEKLVADSGTADQKGTAVLERLAVLYSEAGKSVKADATFKKAVALREQRPGNNNEDLNNCLRHYVEFLKKQNRLDDAKPLEARLAAKPAAKPAAKSATK